MVPAVLLFATGCPGSLQNRDRFQRAETGAATCAIPLNQVAAQILAPRCGTSGCHGSMSPSAGLDLNTPGVGARLVGRNSMRCPESVLADPSNPGESLMVQILGESRPCNLSRMPLGAAMPLSDEEIQCISDWIGGLSAATPDGGSAADAARSDVGGGS